MPVHGSDPNLPEGSTPFHNYAQKVHKRVFGPSSKLRNSKDVQVDHRHNGDFLRVRPRKGGGGGINFKGDYDDGTAYKKGDWVQVQPDNDSATTATPAGQSLPGNYFCIKDCPAATSWTPPEGADEDGDENPYYPKNPLQEGGQSDYWAWVSTWPTLEDGCDSFGNETTAITDSQPKPADGDSGSEP